MSIKVKRMEQKFLIDRGRVLAKFYIPSPEKRAERIINQILNYSEEEVEKNLEHIIEKFSDRHKNIWNLLDKHYNIVKRFVGEMQISDKRRALIGAYFTCEYSVQSAAFFNPSIVPHFNQDGLPKGSQRFILSFRSTGEGHISSIQFRSGVINEFGDIIMDPESHYVEMPEIVKNPKYEKHTFSLKLNELNCTQSYVDEVFKFLSDEFTLSDLEASIRLAWNSQKVISSEFERTIKDIKWIAQSNYEIHFRLDQKLSERIIFPVTKHESNGIEDARFVQFEDEDGSITYYATYTAFNGSTVLPLLLETKDFLSFKMTTLNGKAVKDKGMSLFPRKVKGKFMMISRIDGESLYIMSSKNIRFWEKAKLLKKPDQAWELMQIGNCGSPIETKKGWILLTHGVGTMRQYVISAILLDLDDPSKVIGILEEPLIKPTEEEREGYVPNVVYSCGALLHNEVIIIPYAISDTYSGIATITLKELFKSFRMLQ